MLPECKNPDWPKQPYSAHVNCWYLSAKYLIAERTFELQWWMKHKCRNDLNCKVCKRQAWYIAKLSEFIEEAEKKEFENQQRSKQYEKKQT